MKTIEDRAHEILLKMLEGINPMQLEKPTRDGLAYEAYELAKAMQAEAEKRKAKKDTVSLTKDGNGNCLHLHHEFGHKKCMDCGASLEDRP